MRKNKDNIKYIEKQIRKIIQKNKSIIQIAKMVGTSRKTIGKWVKEFRQKGKIEPKNHIPVNAFPDKFNREIINKYILRKNKLMDRFGNERLEGLWLPTIRYFKAADQIDCSEEHIRKQLINNSLITHRTNRSTKRMIRKDLRKRLAETKNIVEAKAIKANLEIVEKHRIYNGKWGVAGLSIEIDGCFDHWFGNEKYCLYFSIDSFTGIILNLWIEKQETNIGYLNLLKGTFSKYGLPQKIKTDRRNGLSSGKVANAIKELDIDLESSTEPTFKPNVERSFQGAQSLFPNYFMDKKINSPEDLIARKEEILDFMNTWLKRKMSKDNLFIEPTHSELDNFILKEERKVINEVSHISFQGRKMAPFVNGRRIKMYKKVIVGVSTDGKPFALIESQRLKLKEIKNELVPSNIWKMRRHIELEKRKGQSFNSSMSRKAFKIKKNSRA